jgi:hypothetical protein
MIRPAALIALLALLAVPTGAAAKTSHAGWPEITGVLVMHKLDESADAEGTLHSDELLGGHGSDTLFGREGADVMWGDYKPGGQPTRQVDRLFGEAGDDFVYASHGINVIDAGTGNDIVHAHFGRGVIDCGTGYDVAYLSRRGRRGWRVRHCERISYRTLGY